MTNQFCTSIVTNMKLGGKWESIKREITQIENKEGKFNLVTTILKAKKCFWRKEWEQGRDWRQSSYIELLHFKCITFKFSYCSFPYVFCLVCFYDECKNRENSSSVRENVQLYQINHYGHQTMIWKMNSLYIFQEKVRN